MNKFALRNLERIARRKLALKLAIQARDEAAIYALLAELRALTTCKLK